MKKLKFLLVLLALTLSFSLSAQKKEIIKEDYKNDRVEMADTMRSEGKIYVLVAIIVTLFAGFVLYAAMTERKVKKLEKLVKNQE